VDQWRERDGKFYFETLLYSAKIKAGKIVIKTRYLRARFGIHSWHYGAQLLQYKREDYEINSVKWNVELTYSIEMQRV
jgi:hypothetical protein